MGDQRAKDGTLDLEKELSCSICTDVFYQPLTLLDCLHTFCGSCLKEWFSWQASAATTEHPYTCPACRATVRDTKPNATVTTLLDILLRAHPEKGKSQEEKDQIEDTYKIGDDVIPPVHIDQESEDSEDERLLQGARELSLRDMESPSTARPNHTDASTRSTYASTAHGRHRRRHDREAERSTYINYRPEQLARAQQPSNFLEQRRQLDHQSSLRSLLSTTEPDSLAMQEEIMQQIIDDGLLHGIDLNNLTPAQEEDITERIAHAFRARQRQRERHRRRPDPSSSPSSGDPHSRTDSTSHRTLVHPPLSRPHLLDGIPHQSTHHRRRASSQASRASVRSASAATRSEEPSVLPHLIQPASRSATDLSQRAPDPPPHRSARMSNANRRSTDPDSRADTSRRVPSVSTTRPSRRDASSSSDSPRQSSPVVGAMSNRHANPLLALRSEVGPSNSSSPALISSSAISTVGSAEPRLATLSAVMHSPNTAIAAPSTLSVSCSRCKKPDIQYSLHYNCSQCYSGNFTICLSCYRAGKGCLQWFGFGHAAFDRYRRLAPSEAYPSEHKKPHILSPRRYQPGAGDLQEGLFCEGCFAFADECYWHCDSCNDGAWGFCNDCVQKAKHCTHPLQCVGKASVTSRPSSATAENSRGRDLYPAPLSMGRSAFHFSVSSHAPALSGKSLPNAPNPTLYTSLALAVYCDICHRSIPPSNTRLHCHFCNDGNYDICTPCYHALTNSGKIRPEDGLQGWRRCPRGHRMSVVGFEDREGGPRRLVVNDFVGGWALREDGPDGPAASQVAPGSKGQWKWKEEDGTSGVQISTTRHTTMSMLPPDGGVGLRTEAIWSRFPPDEVRDELAFPRNATIGEVENINGDWYWGVYAGRKGLFPGNYVRVI